MSFTLAEKLQIAMLCDLAKPADKRGLNFDFIFEAVVNDDAWALDWKYAGLQLKIPTPPEVKLVGEIIDMWDRLEESFAALSEKDKAYVLAQAYDAEAPHFRGFSGNDEAEQLHIARLLIEDLGRWSRFKGRELDSHIPASSEIYERLLKKWRPIWERKVKRSGPYRLTADELISVLRERIHPEHRQAASGGGWTFDPSKLRQN